jgi:hypothetical protein
MDSWILGLRADEDVQLEFRALFGAPVRSVGRVEVHAFEATSTAAAARILDSAASSLGYAVAALAPDEPATFEDGVEVFTAVERAAALCLAGAPGEFLFALSAARALSSALCFQRARRRPGWRLPLSCVSLADAPRLRSASRDDAARIPERPTFIGRGDELDALVEALAPRATLPFAVVRASPGMGASRLAHEAALRVGARVVRCVVDGPALSAAEVLQSFEGVPDDGPRWLVVEPRDAAGALAIDVAGCGARIPGGAVVALVGSDCDTPWCDPEREVELGPLAPAESRALVRALLGDAAEDLLVNRVARTSGVPGDLVSRVRAAALGGAMVHDARTASWRPRNRRLVSVHAEPADRSLAERRVDALDPVTRRALEVAVATGDGASESALRGALRVVLGPGDHLAALRAHGLVTLEGGTVDVGRAFATAPDAALAGRVQALRQLGGLEALADAERALAQRSPDAAPLFARAARAAMAAGDRAAAVRLLAATSSLPRPAGDASLSAAMRAAAAELGPMATVRPIAGPRASASAAASPEALEAAALAREARGDAPAAMRLRALAALLKGDASLARRVGASGTSVKDHLLGALAHARESRVPSAVRAAVAALAQARRERDAGGEAATLAMLASLYHAVERHDDALKLSGAIAARGR